MLERMFNSHTGRIVTFGRLAPEDAPDCASWKVPSAKMSKILDGSMLPPPPASFSWARDSQALNQDGLENVLANDRYGCCTCSGAGHIIDQALAKSGNPYTPITADQVVYAYSQVTNPPFDPSAIDESGTNPTDVGANEITVLDWWRDHGFLENGGHKIIGHASIDNAKNISLISSCAWLFENIYIGIALPDAWVHPFPSAPGFTWDVAGDPNPDFGHCIIAYGYNRAGLLIDTWGMFGTLTWAAVEKYCAPPDGELHVVFTEDSLNTATLKAPTGFDRNELVAYLQEVGP